jgi:hypothetical protein
MRSRAEGWLVVAAAIGLLLLYARGQLAHTMAFVRALAGS